jgi:hypothetical protein
LLRKELTKQLQLNINTAVGWGKQQLQPACMIWQTDLMSQFQLNWWTKEQNTSHKPVTWTDHIRLSAYMPIPGLDAGGITTELKLRLKFYCS